MSDEPKWAELFGAAPNFTDGKPVDEWLAEQRGESFLRPRNVAEAVAALDAINVDDPEVAHGLADELLLSLVPAEVVAAYQRVVERARWWC